MTTECDLIQRLVDIADALDGKKPLVFSQGQAMDGFTALANFQALANEARAYLSQPEPEGPTDRELVAVLKQAIKDFPPNHPDAKALDSLEYDIEIELRKARAVLARCGRPAVEPEPEYPSDKELLELMPEKMRDEFSCIAKLYSDATGGQVEPGIFRVALNTAALEYAQAVLARSDQTSEFRRFQQTHCYD